MGRKIKNIHYIYKIVCNVTKRYYIGMHSTNNEDDGYMGSGKRLRYNIRKYGVENHIKEILEYYETRELLVEAEKKIITLDILLDKMCMNIMPGGEGGFISEEQQKHRSICGGIAFAKKYKEDNNFRIDFIEKRNNGVKNAHKEGKYNYNTFEGKQHSDESKQKMSLSKKGKGTGKFNSQYGTCWINKDGTDKKIKKEELNNYLSENWIKGRSKKN